MFCCIVFCCNIVICRTNKEIIETSKHKYVHLDITKNQWLKKWIVNVNLREEYIEKMTKFISESKKYDDNTRALLFEEVLIFVTNEKRSVKFSSNLSPFIWELANQGEFSFILFTEDYLESIYAKEKMWFKLDQWIIKYSYLKTNKSKVKVIKNMLKEWAKQYPKTIELMLYQTGGFEKIGNLLREKKTKEYLRLKCLEMLYASDYSKAIEILNEVKNDDTRLCTQIANLENGSPENGFFYKCIGDYVKSKIKTFSDPKKFIKYPVSIYK